MKTPSVWMTALLSLAAVLLPPVAPAETVIRQGSPRVSFVSFQLQTEASQGEFFRGSAFFQLTAPVETPEKVFLHLVPSGQNEVRVNADFFPRLPTSRWEVGQVVEAGPFGLVIPGDLEPGDYEVRTGLMAIEANDKGVRFVREPYTNPDIKNFVVGRIAVKAAEKKEGAAAVPTELDLVTFARDEDLIYWEPRGATISRFQEGQESKALVTIKPEGEYPGVALENYFALRPLSADWLAYDSLEIVIGGIPGGRPGRVILQINDRAGRLYKKEIRFRPGETVREIVSMVDAGGAINISAINSLKIFAPTPSKELSFYLTLLRLRSRGGPTGDPSVSFVRVDGPTRVKRGEVFKLSVVYKLTAPLFPPHKMFVHVYREFDEKGSIGVDVPLNPPIRSWALNQEVAVESGPLMIAGDAPPGNYVVRAGLYIIADTRGGGLDYVKVATWEEGNKKVTNIIQPTFPEDYIKEPYTNPEIRDWEVGKLTVE